MKTVRLSGFVYLGFDTTVVSRDEVDLEDVCTCVCSKSVCHCNMWLLPDRHLLQPNHDMILLFFVRICMLDALNCACLCLAMQRVLNVQLGWVFLKIVVVVVVVVVVVSASFLGFVAAVVCGYLGEGPFS